MSRHAPNGHWLVDARTGERIERHRTRQAALDHWRLRFEGRVIKIVQRKHTGEEVLIVEGTWHQGSAF